MIRPPLPRTLRCPHCRTGMRDPQHLDRHLKFECADIGRSTTLVNLRPSPHPARPRFYDVPLGGDAA